MITALTFVSTLLCVGGLLALGGLVYYAGPRVLLLPFSALAALLLFAGLGAVAGVAVDMLLGSLPRATALGVAAGAGIGAIIGAWLALRR